MNKALRQAAIAGNWKMNKNRAEAAELINALKPIAADKTCGVIISSADSTLLKQI